MKRLLPIAILILIFQCALSAQDEDFIVINAESIDQDRYKGVKGTPYAFEDFLKARIISRQLNIKNSALINYNIYTLSLELNQGSQIIELDESSYWRIEFNKSENDAHDLFEGKEKIILQKNTHQKFQNRLVELVYEGERVMLIKDYAVRIAEVKIENVGKTEKIRKFAHKAQYYLLKDGELSMIKRKKKPMLKTYSNEPEILDFLKKNKINPAKEKDLISFVQFYDKELQKTPIPHHH